MAFENYVSTSTSPMANASYFSDDPLPSSPNNDIFLNGHTGVSSPNSPDPPSIHYPLNSVVPPNLSTYAPSPLEQQNNMHSNSFSIFVGNIPWLATVQELKEYFVVELGNVVHIDFPYDSIKKRARGYANIYFSNEEAANEAIRKYHNLEFRGRRLQVKRPQKPYYQSYSHPSVSLPPPPPLAPPLYYAGTYTPPSSTAPMPMPGMDNTGTLLMTPPTYVSTLPLTPTNATGHSSNLTPLDPLNNWNSLYQNMPSYVPYMSVSHDSLYPVYTALPYATYPQPPQPPPPPPPLLMAPLKPNFPSFVMPDIRSIRNSDKPPDTAIKSNVLWFGNIPLGARWQNVKDIVKATGVAPIRVDLNLSKTNHAPYHSATVIFPTTEDAQIAAGKLSGLVWQTSSLIVRSDRPEFREKNTLFLRNVPYDCTKEQIQELFDEAGINLVHLNLEEFSRGRKGLATAELETPEEARRAVDILNGKLIRDRNLKVSVFERRTYGFRIYIGNIAWKATWQDIKDLFRRYGFNPGRVDIVRDSQNYQSKGYGIVVVGSKEEAQRAIMTLNGASLFGRQIVVRLEKS